MWLAQSSQWKRLGLHNMVKKVNSNCFRQMKGIYHFGITIFIFTGKKNHCGLAFAWVCTKQTCFLISGEIFSAGHFCSTTVLYYYAVLSHYFTSIK